MIVLTCPHCQGDVGSNPSLAGQVVLCPHCKQQFIVPEIDLSVEESTTPKQESPPPVIDQIIPACKATIGFIKKRMSQKKEIRATCNACGHVWHYLPGERMREFGERLDAASDPAAKLGCTMMTCGLGGCLSPFMPTKTPSTLTSRCPKCNSSSISRETVRH